MANGLNIHQQHSGVIARYIKSMLAGALTLYLSMSTVHAELSIQEKDPESSLINAYNQIKDADYESAALHHFVNELTQRVDAHPEDFLAWELLAKIYDQHGDETYAVYAASEAINLGHSSEALQQILLSDSIGVAQDQLQSSYLVGITDTAFLKQYQSALSKIYGDVYGFNYDESLPKRTVRAYRVKTPKYSAKPKASSRSSRAAATKRANKAAMRRRAAAKSKSTYKQAAPVKKSQPTSSGVSDPFVILRQ